MKMSCLIAALVAGAPAFASQAPMFRADPRHTGFYGPTGIQQPYRVKWKLHLDGAVVSSAAVAGGTLFVGSNDQHLYAVDAAAGTVRWKFDAGGRVTSSPAYADGIVYFGSYDGNFYAVSATQGEVVWKFQTQGERRFSGTHLHGAVPVAEKMPDPFDFYLSSPTVDDRRVYFGSGDGHVYALDAKSGAMIWKFATGDVVHSSPAVADATVYVGSWDSYLYAIDASTGKEKWRFKTGDDPDIHNQVGIQSSPAVADGIVYFGCRDSKFYAVDARSGKQKWAFDNKGAWVVGSAAVAGGRVYFATSDSSVLYALDAKSGAVVFSRKFNGWPLFSSPAIAGNALYVGSYEGKLAAVDLSSGKTLWTFQTDGSAKNGRTYTKPDGTPNYDAAFQGPFYDELVVGVSRMLSVGTILASPVIAENVLYVGSTDGSLYALQ